MKKLFTFMLLLATSVMMAQVAGTWKMSPQAAALGVGPELGNISWWSNSEADVTLRACYFDDEYVFAEDGTFTNVLQDETWIEEWQGMDPPGCGTPVAPHNGAAATWVYDAAAGTVTLNGTGAYIGLAKVFNGGELSSPGDAPASISYPIEFDATGDTMTINISIGSGYWRYILVKAGGDPPPPPIVGTWKMSPQAAALGVGPELGNITWWSNSAGDVVTRACYFDDEYVFAEDGTFTNVLQANTWIEPWQGMDPEACGAPVAPHDGATPATWTYDEAAGTVTLNGVGAYIGLAKVINEGELSNPGTAVPTSITYPVEFNATGDTMEINISIGTGYWRFILTTNGGDPPPPSDDVTLPVTFDDDALDYRLVDFGGNWSSIIEDPTDPSNMVVETFRDGEAQTWAGTTVAEPTGLVPAVPFTNELTSLSLRVYSPEAGLPILFKLEVHDNTSVFAEVFANTTVANEWETLVFDFSTYEGFDLANAYNKPVIFFNFGVAGADAGEMTFMWDDIELYDPSAINETKYNLLGVYPNPAKDFINIENHSELNNITIYSVTGSMVYQSEEVSKSIDISSLNKGVYTIHATGQKGEPYTAKFIVN